jgi:endonuclease-3 related protein
MRTRLQEIFEKLLSAFGQRRWWPGDSPLEVIVGAVLTQNTAWRNVEKAIVNMREKGLIDMDALHLIEEDRLAEAIRPSGFYRVKSRRLKALIADIHGRYGASIERMQAAPTEELRGRLLSVKGVGPETADSILLYALNRPVFVVDAYTKRFLKNHGLSEGSDDYDEVQKFFTDNLPRDTYIFNEFHALLVCLCQRHCKKKPDCPACPLADEGGGGRQEPIRAAMRSSG